MAVRALQTVPNSGAGESVRRPNQVEIQALASLVKEARYGDAITRASHIYGLSLMGGFSAVFVNAQSPYPDDAITLPELRLVRITINSFVSVPWLARTIFHERVHVQQFLRGDWGKSETLGEWVNEVEAYDRGSRVYGVLGLSRDECMANQKLRGSYYRQLDASYRLRISSGSYVIKDGDRDPRAPSRSER